MRASNYVETIEENQGIKIACLEEIAYRKGWVTKEKLLQNIQNYPKNNEYFEYLISL